MHARRPERSTRLAPILLLLFAGGALAQDAAPPELSADTRDYDQRHLDLDLVLDMDAGSIRGVATHQLASLADGLTSIRMHLEDMQVESVTADGAACTPTHKDDILTIALDRARSEGETFTLEIKYGGRPTSGLWFFRPTEEHPDIPVQVWTQGQGTENRHWIPLYDLPDDRLTTTLNVTVPEGLQTLSNGTFMGAVTEDAGAARHTWKLDREHPPYIITLVVGTFDDEVRDAAGVEQHDLVPPGWGEWADEVFGRTPDMMGFFQDYTGEPYPWGRYSQVCVWDFHWGGMENTGATTLNMRALHKDGVRPDYAADGLVAHELAHMWFGDLITCRTWNHIWLNEGFATYFTDLWKEHHHGQEDFRTARRGSKEAYMGRGTPASRAARALPGKPTDCGDVQSNAYVKGSSILHMLRGLIGDEPFRDGVRKYMQLAKDKSVESEVLRRAMEETCGEDLSWFFDQWVYGNGFPQLTVSHEWDEALSELQVRVVQTQPVTATMPIFRTPVDIDIHWPGGKLERRRVELHRASHVVRIAGPGRPEMVVFDPDDWLLAEIDHVKTAAEWTHQLTTANDHIARLVAARALGKQGDAGLSPLATAVTKETRYDVRAEICQALGELSGKTKDGKTKHDETAAAALSTAAKDSDSRVRRAALTALGKFPGAMAAPALERALATDTSYYAAAAAAESLGRTKHPTAFDALRSALDRDSHRDVIRQSVMDGLRHLGDARGAEVARGYLAYRFGGGIQHRMRHAALDAMVALAPDAKETREAIVGLIDDPYFRMRRWSAGHAAKLGIKDAIPALEALLGTPLQDGPGVKGSIDGALKTLREGKPTTDAAPAPSASDVKRLEIEKRILELRLEIAEREKELLELAR